MKQYIAEKVVVYIHGKGGNAQEAEHFHGVFDCDVVGGGGGLRVNNAVASQRGVSQNVG